MLHETNIQRNAKNLYKKNEWLNGNKWVTFVDKI